MQHPRAVKDKWARFWKVIATTGRQTQGITSRGKHMPHTEAISEAQEQKPTGTGEMLGIEPHQPSHTTIYRRTGQARDPVPLWPMAGTNPQQQEIVMFMWRSTHVCKVHCPTH
ncbi:hypothetical protein ATANTOWER_012871 [Ataeniobius toweri]|uniref:Uncharacterized protein n=1 Tax=Ataeniobius toweri TaxID=208326 RepID=A0ABU7BGE8_9TELE|nr:hypothetical protein [Ataeniobius toweri]